MIILGVDPGLSITGYGVVEICGNKPVCLKYGGIRSGRSMKLSEKLQKIYDEIRRIIEQFHPTACAIEDIFYHENIKTAIVMGHARGVVMLAAQQADIPVLEYSPREVKMSTVGFGAASKQQVQAMICRLLRLEELPRPLDASDALAVALCHYNRSRFQNLIRNRH